VDKPDIETIAHEIWALSFQCKNPHNDGFVAWGYKQDLYTLKFLIDDALKECPTFNEENEWLTTMEKKRIIKLLKNND
jgi:hypothetical protein